MTGFVVLSTGLQGRVRAAGSALAEGVDLGVFEALGGRVSPAGTRRRAAEELSEKLIALLGDKAPGTTVGLVVPDPGDREVLISVAEVLESYGFVPGILAPRTALAREALRRANQTVGAATWLLDASAAGFTVFSLDGAKRIAVRQDLDQLFEYRRTVVAAAFKAEHRVDIKQVGGTPDRIDAWLEELQRSGRLESEQHVEWKSTEGTKLPLRSQALSKALESVHGSAVLAMETACLEALTERAGAVVVSGSVDAWFHIGPKLRRALPNTYVHILEEDEEAVLMEGLWDRMGEPGSNKVWLLAAGGDAPSDALNWDPLPRAAAAAAAPAPAAAAPKVAAPAPKPAPAAAAAPPPPPAPVVVAPPARSRTPIYAGMAALAAAQILMLLGFYGRGSSEAEESVDELRAELASLSSDLDGTKEQLAQAVEVKDTLQRDLERMDLALQEQANSSPALVQESLGTLRTDLDAVQASLETQNAELVDLPVTVAGVVSRLDGVETSLAGLQTEVAAVDERSVARLAVLSQTIDGLDQRVARVDDHALVLAELTALSAAAPDPGDVRTGNLIDASALAELTERIDRTETGLAELRGNFQEPDDSTVLESLLYPDVSSQRMRVFNDAQTRIARLGEDSEGHGSMKLYNDVGEYSVLLGSGQGGDAGFVGTYGRDGQELFVATSHASSGAAHVALNNKDGRRRIAMTTNSNDDAVLWLFNRDGKVVEVIGGGGDLAEAVRPAEGAELRPGMVVRSVGADADGPLVVPVDSAADPRAMGILSGAGELMPAITFNRTNAAGEEAVALAGQVYCLVDATRHPIQPGDMLVSAELAGHAQRADPEGAPQGAVLGKAVEGLEAGTGLIRVWIGSR